MSLSEAKKVPNERNFDQKSVGQPTRIVVNPLDKHKIHFKEENMYLSLNTSSKSVKITLLCEFPENDRINDHKRCDHNSIDSDKKIGSKQVKKMIAEYRTDVKKKEKLREIMRDEWHIMERKR